MFNSIVCSFAVLVAGQGPTPQSRGNPPPAPVSQNDNRPVRANLGSPISMDETPPAIEVTGAGVQLPKTVIVDKGEVKQLPNETKPDNGKNGKDDKNGKDGKEDEEKKDGPWRLFPDPVASFNITGWIFGTGNLSATNGSSRYNGPLTSSDQEGVYINQLWLNMNRPLKECFSVGANLDVYFGNDYINSLSRGFENKNARGWLPQWWDNQDYGMAIPQAYLEVGTTKLSLKAGHFYTPHGYMVVQATGNFFNSLPYGYMMTNPYTHFGGQMNATLDDHWSITGGIVNGWDALDRPVNAPAYMAGFKYSFNEKKGYFSTMVITGQEPENLGTNYSNRTLVTNLFDYNLTDRLEFVFENNIVWQGNEGLGTSVSHSYIPYLFYKINDCWRAGIRYEYFRDPGGFIAAERAGNPNNGPFISSGVYTGDMHTIAVGLNWKPHGSSNLMIRPEMRYDWFNGSGAQPFDGSDHQIMFVLGAIMQF